MEGQGVSVVVPIYNSAATLSELVQRTSGALGSEPKHEIVLVNDGSHDKSWDRCVALTLEDPNVRAIDLVRNVGQHNALLAGIRAARYDVVVTMDDDLQHPPEEIPRLLAALALDVDVVYGFPRVERHGVWRSLASQVTKFVLQGAMGASMARKVSAFRAFRTSVRESFSDYRGPYVNLDVLLTWGTTRFAAVLVGHDPRREGNSGYTFRSLVAHAVNMMTGFSALPLQLASLLGFSLAAFGFLVLVYVIGRFIIEGGSVPGFPFLASIIAIFSGAQLFALGIIGEYLARMHFRLMDRPPYAIRCVAAVPDRKPQGTGST
jgi:glycosyltransferase involved in cell wall biosynthesis